MKKPSLYCYSRHHTSSTLYHHAVSFDNCDFCCDHRSLSHCLPGRIVELIVRRNSNTRSKHYINQWKLNIWQQPHSDGR